ncbi:MAG: phasin family protein [Gammaproteobacteria bacterium]|nr:phasin family protein [Gammaproteobacteria bacterium]
MIISLFNKILEIPQVLPDPLTKANKLLVESMEKILLLQMNIFKSYLDMSLNQMRAAAEITDMESFQDFCKRQSEIAQTVQHKLIRDSKALSDMTLRLKAEMDHLTQATLQEVLSKAA